MKDSILNKLLLYLFLAIIILHSCKKEDPDLIPGEYDEKVLVEEFTAEWCGFCTLAAKDFNAIIDKYSDQTLCVGMHYSDFYEVKYPATASYLFDFFTIEGLPGTLIDRKQDQSKEWIVQVENKLGYKSNAGIKIESKMIENNLYIKVHYTANQNYNNILLSVYLIEDHVAESSPGAQSGGGGNFVHRNVLREVLTSKTGDPVQIKGDSNYIANFSVNGISKYKKADLKVIAFLNKGVSNSFEFINGNQVVAGQNSGW